MSCPSVFDGIGQQIVKYDRDDIRIEIDIFLYRFHFDIDSYMLILIQLLISQSYFCNQIAQVAFLLLFRTSKKVTLKPSLFCFS